MATSVGMASSALVLIGDNSISALTEDDAAANLYTRAYRAFLSEFPWPFALKAQRLSRNTASPDDLLGYDYSFNLPADHIRTLRVSPNNDYRVIGGAVYSNEEALLLEYVYAADESVLPPHAEEAMIHKLAFEFAKSVTEDQSAMDTFYQTYKDRLQKAMVIESQGAPAIEIQDSPFTNPYYNTDLYANRYK